MTRARFTHNDAMTLWQARDVYRVQAVFKGLLVAWTARGCASVGPALVSALGAPVARPVGTPGPVVVYRSRPARRADLVA